MNSSECTVVLEVQLNNLDKHILYVQHRHMLTIKEFV